MLATIGLMLPLFSGEAVATQQSQQPAMQWDWTAGHRFYMQSDVQLPMMMWFSTGFNKQARVDYFELELLVDCAPGTPERRNSFEVLCTLEQVALRAESLPQEQGLVQPIVEELVERLTGAVVQLQVRSDGRLSNIDLEDLERRNQRFGRMNENLRLVVSRVISGLDLPMPSADEEAWLQHSSWIMRAPAADGSSGSSELVHRIVERSGSNVTIHSGGRAMIVPGEGINKYDARMVGSAVFDTRTGQLLDRTWTLAAAPTASSLIARGTEGFPYLQSGRIVALSEGQSWNLGQTGEIAPQGKGPSAIQQSLFLGLNPN